MCSGGNYRAPMKSEKNTTKMCLYCLLLLFLWGKQSLEWLRNVLNSTIKWKTMIRPCFLCNARVLHRFIKVMKAVLLVGLAVEGPGWIGSLADDRTTPRTRTVRVKDCHLFLFTCVCALQWSPRIFGVKDQLRQVNTVHGPTTIFLFSLLSNCQFESTSTDNNDTFSH